MTDENKLTTYVIHGVGSSDEWDSSTRSLREYEHIVQAAGFEFKTNYRERPVIVFVDADGATVGAFADWSYFEAEGGVIKREIAREITPKAPEHR